MTQDDMPSDPTSIRMAPTPHPLILVLQYRFAQLARLGESILLVAAGLLLVYLAVVLFLQVLFRYVLERPLPWSEESARFALVWFGMLAAGVAAFRGLHFNFRWFTLFFPPKFRFWLRQSLNVLTIGLLVLMYFQSLKYLDIIGNRTAPATQLNMRIPHLGVTVSLIGMLFVYTCDLLDAIFSRVTGHTFSEREKREAQLDQSLSPGARDL